MRHGPPLPPSVVPASADAKREGEWVGAAVPPSGSTMTGVAGKSAYVADPRSVREGGASNTRRSLAASFVVLPESGTNVLSPLPVPQPSAIAVAGITVATISAPQLLHERIGALLGSPTGLVGAIAYPVARFVAGCPSSGRRRFGRRRGGSMSFVSH